MAVTSPAEIPCTLPHYYGTVRKVALNPSFESQHSLPGYLHYPTNPLHEPRCPFMYALAAPHSNRLHPTSPTSCPAISKRKSRPINPRFLTLNDTTSTSLYLTTRQAPLHFQELPYPRYLAELPIAARSCHSGPTKGVLSNSFELSKASRSCPSGTRYSSSGKSIYSIHE